MNDVEIYLKYVKYEHNHSLTSHGKAYKLFSSVSQIISNDILAFVDLDLLKQECAECFRFLYIYKVLKTNTLIEFHFGESAFKVLDHVFTNIDDAIKATNNKAFL